MSLTTDNIGNFRDSHNRVITLRGINLDGCAKLPTSPPITTFTFVDDENKNDPFWDGDNVSFVGRPFTLNEAPQHLNRLKSWGYNLIRYVYSWEAIEHKGPGTYDEEFIDYSIEILKLLKDYGFYIILDPHQDVWGRFSGGSGAPLWTYYAVGLNPMAFQATNAAFVQNVWPEGPENFPKMFWATNYYRQVCQVMFTLFFAGKDFAPKAIINDMNIQDYLQDHLLNAMLYFYKRIAERTTLFEVTSPPGGSGGGIFAVESLNEPNSGLVGFKDIGVVPEDQNLKLGTCPTAFQSMLLASGYPATMDYYIFSSLGPRKSGNRTVDPMGVSVWLTETDGKKFDTKYGWTRSPNWKFGECIWAQHGVWDPQTLDLLRPDYFAFDDQGNSIDESHFVNVYFVDYWIKFYQAHRQALSNDLFLLCQPPVLALPPLLRNTEYLDDHVVYAPHFYDGITLMLKRWNRVWNVDCLGYLRGKYLSPLFAIKFGEKNIRKCLREEFTTIKQEGIDYMGNIPCLMSETGIPFDMDERKSYADGDYSSQIGALDASSSAVEAANISCAFWGYTCLNTHEFGDSWNGEDFSFWSNDIHPEDGPPAGGYMPLAGGYTDDEPLAGGDPFVRSDNNVNSKVRALSAVLRPFPVAVVGTIMEYSFDLNKVAFYLKIDAGKPYDLAPTEIFLPEYHFPHGDADIQASSGRWKLDRARQLLYWWHSDGDQWIEIKPFVDKASCSCTVM